MKTHELKCHPHFFEALKRGDKNFEIRRNDRNYQCGDTLVIRNYDPAFGLVLGEPALRFTVTYIMNTEDFPAIQPGFVIMGIKPVGTVLTPLTGDWGGDADPSDLVRLSPDQIEDLKRRADAPKFRIVSSDDVDANIFVNNRLIGYTDQGKLHLIGVNGHAEPICDVDDISCLPTLLQQHYKAI